MRFTAASTFCSTTVAVVVAVALVLPEESVSFSLRPAQLSSPLTSRLAVGSTRWVSASSSSAEKNDNNNNNINNNNNDNKAMAFLRKIGRVGGNRDFRHAIGVDEGESGKTTSMKPLTKIAHAFQSCAVTGLVDDMSEPFPVTCTGTSWSGFTDQVMGGISMGNLSRELFHGKWANVLRGQVRLEHNGGFVQMATDLATSPAAALSGRPSRGPSWAPHTVDVSHFDGVEMNVLYQGTEPKEHFNVHLKTASCSRPFSSYRATFEAPSGKWTTVRIPWSNFRGHGPGAVENEFDTSQLTRAGIVAIGKEMDVTLGLSSFRFFRNGDREESEAKLE